MAAPTVVDVRAAIERQDWSAAQDLAEAAQPTDPGEAAELADLRAEALWWLGRVDDCISAREDAYHGYLELGRSRDAGQCAVWLWEHHAISALAGDRRCVAAAGAQRARRRSRVRRVRRVAAPGGGDGRR